MIEDRCSPREAAPWLCLDPVASSYLDIDIEMAPLDCPRILLSEDLVHENQNQKITYKQGISWFNNDNRFF